MNTYQLEIQLLAATVALACALPGVFLVLRRLALMADAISHAMLLGIVLAFFVVEDLASPILLLSAAAMGLVTVSLVELLNRTRRVREDAAIGLVFPALFAAAVVLISRFAGNVHLDTDAVLLGEIAFAPFRRLELFGADLGPKSLAVMAVILVINVVFLSAFYKELKVATFDPALAAAMGFAPALLNYGFMALVSVTAVGAFDAVGAVLVVALMIAPPAAAHLWTDRLSAMMVLSALLGVASAVSGYWVARALDASIAGAMAAMTGVFFAASHLLAPDKGLLAGIRRRAAQRLAFAETMLAIHLFQHRGTPDEWRECRIDHLSEHLRWPGEFAERVVRRAERRGVVERAAGERLILTPRGTALAEEAIIR